MLDRAISRKSLLREELSRESSNKSTRRKRAKKKDIYADKLRKVRAKSENYSISLNSKDTRHLCDLIRASV